jgi:hypothetical protein
MGGNDTPPRAYSTQVDGDYSSGYQSTGYNVVIAPDELKKSIDTYRAQLANQSPEQLVQTLASALVSSDAFGKLPNAMSAVSQVRTFVDSHVTAMKTMGVSIEDFIARVQAAADLGYEADPVTKQRAAFAQAHQRMME